MLIFAMDQLIVLKGVENTEEGWGDDKKSGGGGTNEEERRQKKRKSKLPTRTENSVKCNRVVRVSC